MGISHMEGKLYEFCISTILDRHRLEEFALKGRGSATEGRAWKTAHLLLQKSRDIGAQMPVILSDAAYNAESLLLWGLLQKIEIDGERTTVQFNGVKRIPGKHRRTELILRSSGKSIAPHFIRPYAICRTPGFLK
jgi:hypothetical protein